MKPQFDPANDADDAAPPDISPPGAGGFGTTTPAASGISSLTVTPVT
jgi:hypothetical protein